MIETRQSIDCGPRLVTAASSTALRAEPHGDFRPAPCSRNLARGAGASNTARPIGHVLTELPSHSSPSGHLASGSSHSDRIQKPQRSLIFWIHYPRTTTSRPDESRGIEGLPSPTRDPAPKRAPDAPKRLVMVSKCRQTVHWPHRDDWHRASGRVCLLGRRKAWSDPDRARRKTGSENRQSERRKCDRGAFRDTTGYFWRAGGPNHARNDSHFGFRMGFDEDDLYHPGDRAALWYRYAQSRYQHRSYRWRPHLPHREEATGPIGLSPAAAAIRATSLSLRGRDSGQRECASDVTIFNCYMRSHYFATYQLQNSANEPVDVVPHYGARARRCIHQSSSVLVEKPQRRHLLTSPVTYSPNIAGRPDTNPSLYLFLTQTGNAGPSKTTDLLSLMARRPMKNGRYFPLQVSPGMAG
jgi:hypothetical protein